MQPTGVIECGNALGESIVWRASDQTLWWTDVEERQLYCLHWPGREPDVFATPERLASFAFVAGTDDWLICGFETGFAYFNPAEGVVDWIARPLETVPGARLNDGRTDRHGRFWCGSMVEDAGSAGAADAGVLYRLDADLELEIMRRGIRISNGLCWSPDGTMLYFADSPRREIGQYIVTPEPAGLGAGETLARFGAGEYPDGATVDAGGNIWVAVWGAARVDCFDCRGEQVARLPVPATQPTCPCFGGPELTTLFVSSARAGLTPLQRADEPLAGSVFFFDNAGKGLEEPRFAARHC